MKLIFLFTIIPFLLFSQNSNDKLFQISTIDALMQGIYEGDKDVKFLLTKGNTGIGTYNQVDGEMLVNEGSIYQIKHDGSVVTPADTLKIPFAVVKDFNPDTTINLKSEFTLKQLNNIIDSLTDSPNFFYVVKVKGSFRNIKTRSVQKQNKPYPPLLEVAAKQTVFYKENINGILIGLRCPLFVKGINVPGYHYHFLSEDNKTGGHVLDFTISNPLLEIDKCTNYEISLLNTVEFKNANFGKDFSKELHKVESESK